MFISNCRLYLCCSALVTPYYQVLHGQAPPVIFVFVFWSNFYTVSVFLSKVNVNCINEERKLSGEPIKFHNRLYPSDLESIILFLAGCTRKEV